jgi:hypothetical protein
LALGFIDHAVYGVHHNFGAPRAVRQVEPLEVWIFCEGADEVR